MIQAPKSAAVRPAAAPSDPRERRPEPQALAAPSAGARGNWELRPLGAVAFALASARG